MNISAGLVGLPNVGKSTLFNALTKSNAPAENYPFCTINPHIAITNLPDKRLELLTKIFNSQKTIPATVKFVDIAGLVRGAASGEGLGNQFLSHIREVNLILHILKCFDNTSNNPLDDYEIIISELLLKDLESIEKRLIKINHLLKSLKNKPLEYKILTKEINLLEKIKKAIDETKPEKIKDLLQNSEVKTIPLLSSKNSLIIANISEQNIENYQSNPQYQILVKKFGLNKVIPICAKLEYELSRLNTNEANEMMNILGLKENSLEKIIKQTYKHLNLITFFTCGIKETHAWPLKKGTNIKKAGGNIHSDLEKGFICADVYNIKDILKSNTETSLREKGKIRTEGQDYIVQDGDIIHIKFNI